MVKTFTTLTRLSALITAIPTHSESPLPGSSSEKTCQNLPPPKKFSRAAAGRAFFSLLPPFHSTYPAFIFFGQPARLRAETGPRMCNLTGKGQVGGGATSHRTPHHTPYRDTSVRGAVRGAMRGGPQERSPASPPGSEHPSLPKGNQIPPPGAPSRASSAVHERGITPDGGVPRTPSKNKI